MKTLLLLILEFGSLICFSTCTQESKHIAGKIIVVTSISPLGDFVNRVGGEDVSVIVVVPPGSNPHTFDLTPELLRSASAADLLVLNGADLEYWADKLKENITNPKTRTIITSSGIPLLGGHDHGNPHVWLDPSHAARAVMMIQDALIGIRPESAQRYQSNAKAYLDSLKVLDSWITGEVAGWRTKKYIGYHASWDYFSKRYGLEQVATMETTPGRELSAKEFGNLLLRVKSEHVRALFGDFQSPTKTIRMLAQETGAKLVILDPIGGSEKNRGYVQMMRYNVREMGSALR